MDDVIARRYLGENKLLSYGFETGNWFGFSGVPMGIGINSFSEIHDVDDRQDKFRMSARILMPKMDVKAEYSSGFEGDSLVTRVDIQSRQDGWIGDMAIHSRFDDGGLESFFNGKNLSRVQQYIYSEADYNEILIGKNRLMIECGCKDTTGNTGLIIFPYAARIRDGSVRYHTRLLCVKGKENRLLLRTKGALGCVGMPFRFPGYDKLLYRKERQAPSFLSNTQLCMIAPFPAGETISLWHKITKN